MADDDPDQLVVTKALLECLGHEVVVAKCPSEDLRFPNAAGQPDSREGMTLIRRIREAGYRLPVVVLSGWPADLYGAPEEEMVSRILVKPVGIPVLLEMIAELTSVSAPFRNHP